MPYTSAIARPVVSADHGNIVLNDGKTHRLLTHSGKDADPLLAPDGKHVVFVRTLALSPDMKLCDEGNGTPQLWIADVQSGAARLLLAAHGRTRPEETLCTFGALAFSADSRLLYFLSTAWATSDALHVIDLPSGKSRYLLPANSFQVITQCRERRYEGDLVISQHRYFVFGGSYDWLWLFTPDGREIGPVTEDGGSLDMLKDTCEPD